MNTFSYSHSHSLVSDSFCLNGDFKTMRKNPRYHHWGFPLLWQLTQGLRDNSKGENLFELMLSGHTFFNIVASSSYTYLLHIIDKVLAICAVCLPGGGSAWEAVAVLFLVLWVMPLAVCFCQDGAQTSCSLFNLSLGPGLKSSPSFRYYSTLLSLSHPSF